MNCIYCGKELLNKSYEHIVQSALGARLGSNCIICQECNNYFANKDSGYIDTKFTEQFSYLRNMLNIWSGRKNPPPIIRKAFEHEDILYDLLPGGVPTLSKTIRHEPIIDEQNKKMSITISAANKEKVKKHYINLVKQYGDVGTVEAKYKNIFIDEQKHFSIEFGGWPELKGVMKSIINLIFYLKREVKKDIPISESDIEKAIQFVRYDKYNDGITASVDTKNVFCNELNRDKLPIVVTVGVKDTFIFGTLTVLGYINFSAILSDDYHGESFAYRLIQYPNSSERKIDMNMECSLYDETYTLEYAKVAQNQFLTMRENVAQMLHIAQEQLLRASLYNEIEKLYKSYFADVKGDDVIPNNITEIFYDDVISRFIKIIYRSPYEEDTDIKFIDI